MWSAASPKPAENLHSDATTPHNATLRIIRAADIDAVAGSVLASAVSFSDDADAPGKVQGVDLALEAVLGQLATVFLK
jgi:hypothetical protein